MRVSDDGGSSARPTNWWILGLSSDPTPGDPFAAVVLSGQMSGVADGALESRRGVLSLMNDPAITGWVGASGDAFRAVCAPFPDQLATMHASYQDAANALTAFNTVATSAQGTADSAYYSAHTAAQKVGLSDEDLHGAVGFEGWGYSSAVKEVLLAKQRAAQPAPSPSPSAPGYIPAGHGPAGPGSDQLQGPFQAALETMVQAQISVLSAKDDYDAAVTRCVNALEQASDASLTGATWSGANGGTFDQRYTTFGGDPSQLHFDGSGFDTAEAVADAAAWQKAKLNPNDPANQEIIANVKASLADHLNDPDYLNAFANTTPDGVTAYQGLPAVDADKLNRAKLAQDIANLGSACPDSLRKLQQYLKPDSALYRPGMLLLGFDTEGAGHVAVSYGNPDTAQNTAVYVPGTTSKLSSASGDFGRAAALYDATAGKSTGDTASVYWLGYDAPDWPWSSGDLGPSTQSFADAGGPKLAAFVNALNAQHQGPTNLTLIGHSYGSTVVGDALAHFGAQAQGAIFVGSPGATVDHASELHVNGNVWSSKATFDPVPDMSIGITGLDDDHTQHFGNDPTSSAFGGHTFDSGDGTPLVTVDPFGIGKAHSEYWNSSNVGNLANIVTGHTDQVPPMTETEKEGALDFRNPLTGGGSLLQQFGHMTGSPSLQDAGAAVHAFGSAVNAPAGAVDDLFRGDLSGAGSTLADAPGQAWSSVKDLGSTIGDLWP